MTKFLDNGFTSGPFYDEVVSSRDIANLSIFHENFQKLFTEKELQKVFTMFDTYKKVASPIAHLPLRTFTTPLNRCLQQEGKNPGALYGECLLQKLLVIENLEPESVEFLPTISTYQSWFHGLEKSSANYAKFEEASQILKHMQR